ncbi:MAG: LytR C-terminal domain-containing protein, partial [Telluria sp.]
AQTLPPAALPQRRAGADKALLEISNGNGVTGMAARLARKMGDPALRVVRLSNQKRFNVRQTRVEYQSEFRAAAQRLAERFGTLAVVEVADCKLVNMRLVIGRDLVRTNFALRPLAKPAQMAKAGGDQTS